MPSAPDCRPGSRALRGAAGIALGLAVLAVGGLLALRAAVEEVRVRVEASLGEASSVRALRVGLTEIELDGLRISGGPGWPAPDAFRAESVVIAPSVLTLLGDELEIRSIRVTQGYVSLSRTRDRGVRVLPTLLEGGEADDAAAAPSPAATTPPRARSRSVSISELILEDGSAELFDAVVAKPPFLVRLDHIAATISDVEFPATELPVPFELQATLEGRARAGTLSISGWTGPVTGDLEAKGSLRGADLLAVEPYVLRSGDARFRQGTFMLEIDARIKGRQLNAPGRVVLSGLEFASAHGIRDTVLGLPRTAVMKALQGRNGEIAIDFTLSGNVDDPAFSVQEDFATRTTVALAETLGVSVRGVVEGVGGLTRFGIEKTAEAARGAAKVLEQGFEKLRE